MTPTDQTPSVSVIIPTYNSGQAVVEAVTSVLAQTWPHIELIVVDDGSIDDTRDLLKPYLDHICYVYQPNKGRSAARNRGIAMTTGDYVAFLDADDTWYPTKLEQQLSGLRHNLGTRWAYCKTRLVDETNVPMQSDFWSDHFGSGASGSHQVFETLLTAGLEISTSTVLVERETLVAIGWFDETLATSEDTDMWLRLAHVSPVLFVPEALGTRRIDTSTTFRERVIAYQGAYYGLQAIRRSLKKLGLDPATSSLAQRALRRGYLNSALIELSAGNCDAAIEYWQEALRLADSDSFQKNLATQLAYFALSGARYHPDGPAHAESILTDLLIKVPVSARTQRILRRAAYTELFAAIAFMYSTKGQAHLACRYARKALLTGTSHWRNLGVWKQALSH